MEKYSRFRRVCYEPLKSDSYFCNEDYRSVSVLSELRMIG